MVYVFFPFSTKPFTVFYSILNQKNRTKPCQPKKRELKKQRNSAVLGQTVRIGNTQNESNSHSSLGISIEFPKSHTAYGNLLNSINNSAVNISNMKAIIFGNSLLIYLLLFLRVFYCSTRFARVCACVSLLCTYSWLRFNVHCFVSNTCTASNMSTYMNTEIKKKTFTLKFR